MALKPKKYRSMAGMMTLYVFMGLIILWETAKDHGYDNLLILVREKPFTLSALLLPLIASFIFMIKANSKKEILDFLSKHLLKYISRFTGFIITVYLAYFIIIPYEIKDFKDTTIIFTIKIT